MAEDIRETGPVGLKGLNRQNSQKDLEEQWRLLKSIPNTSYSSEPQRNVGLAAMDAGYGSSQYDTGIRSSSQFEDIGDIRYDRQPWYDVFSNGVGKMFGRAATTFASSLVGMPYGIMQTIREGDPSKIWDNDVTEGLANVDKWFEDNLKNYQSREQQENPYFRLGDMNWWADNLIANAGFTLGAAASMATGAGALGLMGRALGFVNKVGKTTKGAVGLISSLFSATGEGMIEARQGVEERNRLEMKKLEDTMLPEKQALEEEMNAINQEYAATRNRQLITGSDGVSYDPAYLLYRERMDSLRERMEDYRKRYDAGRQEIIETGREMGNRILLANQVLLSAGNMIQFSKGAVKSFDKARHAAESASKTSRPFGVNAVRAGKDISKGYDIQGKNFGKAIAATKGLLTEGSEEMNQQWIQSSAGAYYNRKNADDYWKAKYDREAYKDTAEGLHTWGNAISQGFSESWGDINQWEQFLIGGITGMAGTYMPTKLFNQDKTKSVFDPRRYGSWEGGAANEIKDFNERYRQFEENIDDLNKILESEDFPGRVKSMVAHTFTERQKSEALDKDDKKAWKDADDKQTIHDIQAFLRAGKMDDLRAIYQEIGSDLSDDDIQNIIKTTTREVTKEEDKAEFDKNTDSVIARHKKNIDNISSEIDRLTSSSDEYGDDVEGRSSYLSSIVPKIAELREKMARENDAIQMLEQQKRNYVGRRHFEGAFIDENGNQNISNDRIREDIRHNGEELNRKLDSYLDSINAVNMATKGRLSKDQEDNLAYLHNLGKESLVRAGKIIGRRRKDMPGKFLMKTAKTPEQLADEYASSDLAFSRNDNTREGYVEVDTSLMDDESFMNFFVRELLWGGNIDPSFSETEDEKAAREEEEKSLSEEDRKKKAKERISKKWKDALEKRQKEAEEQREVNGTLMAQHFIEGYRKKRNASSLEEQKELDSFFQDIVEAASLVSQSGEYYSTLREYMNNPEKSDRNREKEEEKAQKESTEDRANKTFSGKSASQIKQEVANGEIDIDFLDDFAGADLSNITDEDARKAQEEVKKAQNGNRKASALKQHIQEQLGDTPTQEELRNAQIAMQMVDSANLATDNPEELSIDLPELNQIPLDEIDPTANIDDVEEINKAVKNMVAIAFNAIEEDKNAQNDIPVEIPKNADGNTETPENTGKDPIAKVQPSVVAPSVSSPSEAEPVPVPKNPVTQEALENVILETARIMNPQNTNGTWRSNTTRHPYGKSTGTYHDTLDKKSVQYRRSKAIWEYLNNERAFDRQENSSADRIKSGDTVHFMVMNFSQEIYNRPFAELAEDERVMSLTIIMLNERGEVIGDLPLAQLEPSYRNGRSTQQVKDLMSLQDKVFRKFEEHYNKNAVDKAIVDGVLTIEGTDNLGLTFDVTKKPLVSKVKQVMRGAVPYRKSEINTLNDVANGSDFELGILVTGNTVARKKGDKIQDRSIIVPKIGELGQPYLLLPTPSGEKVSIPFYTTEFDAERHRFTKFYGHLSDAIISLIENNSQTTEGQKNAFMKSLDVLKGLLQVDNQKGVKVIDVKGDSITLHLQSLTDEQQKIDIEVPITEQAADIAKAIINRLSGTKINVSLQYLNSTIKTGKGASEKESQYNQVIGEIATVNLPKATHHTVNGWFTVELAPSAILKASQRVETRTTGIVVRNIGGRNIEIDIDKMTATDPDTGDAVEDNEQIALTIAQIKAAKPQYKDKENIKVSVNGGKVRTYGIKEGKFVGEKPEATVTAQPEVETPDISDVPAPSGFIRFDDNGTQKKPETEMPANNVSAGNKTIEQIEDEMKTETLADGARVIPAKIKDAWAAIPDSLKLEMANSGMAVQLEYNRRRVIVSMLEREKLVAELTKANMYALRGGIKAVAAAKYMRADSRDARKADIQKERKWLQKNLPMFNSEDRLKIIEGLIEIPGEENWAWGKFEAGVITLSNMAARGVVYHEAFHVVTQTMLDDNELNALYEAASERYHETDAALLEELLAEEFRKYVQREETPVTGFIRKIFRRILNAMKSIGQYRDPVQQLFYRINNGEFKTTLPRAERGNNIFYSRKPEGKYISEESPVYKTIRKEFDAMHLESNKPWTIGRKWTAFKERWSAEGYTPIAKYSYDVFGKGRNGYRFFGVMLNADAVAAHRENRKPSTREQYAVVQAREGGMELLKWDRLLPEQQMNLMDAGMPESMYQNLSLEEKRQWVGCRA